MTHPSRPPAPTLFWWIRQILLTLVGCFFLMFGVQILIGAYGLNDPFSFVLTFFASNLIILISAVLIIGFIYRMIRIRKYRDEDLEE